MTRTAIYLLVLGIALSANSKAQTLKPEVFSTAGDVGAFPGGFMTFTIGEPLVQTAVTRQSIFTFGFQQPGATTPCKVYIPNAFTPNSDGLNDEFIPVTMCEILDFSLNIYNRWGELIFNSADPELGWDGFHKGELAPSGIYTYVFTYRLNRGFRNEYKAERGTLMLLK